MDVSQELDRAWALFSGKQYDVAFLKYQHLAERGIPSAQDFLGWLHLEGKGVPKDLAAARHWFKRAAEAGYVWGQCHLGYSYLTEANYPEAKRWLEQAAVAGSAPASYRLGVMYQFGQGVSLSEEKASEYYEAAANQGHFPARRNLTRLRMARERGLGKLKWWLLLVANAVEGALAFSKNPDDIRIGRH